MRLTQEYVQKLFQLDVETGALFWKIRGKGIVQWQKAGSTNKDGYITIMIDKVNYNVHSVIWLFLYGEWPAELDHINRVRSDNRPINLRKATRSQNNINARIRNDNSSGFKGVARNGKGWRAFIRHKGKQVHLGTFNTKEKAAAAYKEAATRLYGEFAGGCL
jgi:hypothetical protein